ncbi:hypothetical protein Taro_022082 [Colocasia esculenta]|uniref:Uncharacterized protein n=1 Tax=Colocasia esculenta TaxID=4460 RepID=A0A843V0I2_COLES|nr:hypothetical protein [Colocasia esculenta]
MYLTEERTKEDDERCNEASTTKPSASTASSSSSNSVYLSRQKKVRFHHMSLGGQHTESIRTEGSPMTQNNATSNEQGKCRRTEVGKKGKGKMFAKDVGSSALQMIADASRERNAMLERVFAKELGHQSNNGQPNEQEIPSIQQVLRDLKNIPTLPYRVFLKSMNLFTDPNMRILKYMMGVVSTASSNPSIWCVPFCFFWLHLLHETTRFPLHINCAYLAWDVDDCLVHGNDLQWNAYIAINSSGDWIWGKKFPWYEELVQIMTPPRLDE